MGLHHWNFDCIDGDFVIWSKENAVNVSKQLEGYADIRVSYEEKDDRDDQWIDVLLKKKRCFNLSQFFNIEEENKIMAGFIDKLFYKLAQDGQSFHTKLKAVCV